MVGESCFSLKSGKTSATFKRQTAIAEEAGMQSACQAEPQGPKPLHSIYNSINAWMHRGYVEDRRAGSQEQETPSQGILG